MKKFLLLMFALTVLTSAILTAAVTTVEAVEAADVPDIKRIAPTGLVLTQSVPADENSPGLYKYTCTDGHTHRYLDRYAQLLVDNGFVVIDGRQTGDDMIWGLIHPDKDVPLFEFKLDTPVHVSIEDSETEIQIHLAPGLTYGD